MLEFDADRSTEPYFPLSLPVSQAAWEAFGLDDVLPENWADGSQDTTMLRRTADRVNAMRYERGDTAPPVPAGHLMAFALLDEVLRYIVDLYCLDTHAGAMDRALYWARQHGGEALTARPKEALATLFPPQCVRDGRQTPADYLGHPRGRMPINYEPARELILLNLAVQNKALRTMRFLFDDAELKRQAPYESLVYHLAAFFDTQPELPDFGGVLFEVLAAPMRACPDSLEGQLDFIRVRWSRFLPQRLMRRLAMAAGFIKEETRLRGFGPGPLEVLDFSRAVNRFYEEPEGFSVDRDWMSNVVLIAKNIYVWLDQLSKHYGRTIQRLDQIPDDELDRLRRWGFTGLWLIGLWERSSASQQIKQITGNPEAIASAYSLYDYIIAHDLGGEPAYESLRQRAWERGIRLASDMVPNHVGVYSKWVVEHPDWFIQAPHPPFPSYRYTGIDISPDERVCVQIEDGYWERRDAAVVFKRTDTWTGEERYIYHGNDGTNMPWNDTAQLNFLVPEVREAVIQTILHVARRFPIIRFDAAMTLAKKHYQRLWFPQPGEEGAIPSRAEHGMTRAEFDQCFPKEFWREVVDRISAEAPDTLLLAEAFWLMEGYFVRTLGMHRVYNSAFMNMLKMEENEKYRSTVRNVLEFSPEVLKRFVNFMNNPDELTAVEQFGRDDKYYGVAVLMVTMPGLPMFGHGQVEGYTEKYGMEYRRAYWDETPDQHMIARHEREIFPLMRRRHLFAGADQFAFFDFETIGGVDENVFAYTNARGAERALVVYNNRYNTTHGRILTSTPINAGTVDDKRLVRRTLVEALGLGAEDNRYCLFRDHRTGLEFIRNCGRLAREGLHLDLDAYDYYVFLQFREVVDYDGTWSQLESDLGRRGVTSIDEAYQELVYAEVLEPFRGVMNGPIVQALSDEPGEDEVARFEEALTAFLAGAAHATETTVDLDSAVESVVETIASARTFIEARRSKGLPRALTTYLKKHVPEEPEARRPLAHIAVHWALMRGLSAVLPITEGAVEDLPGLHERLLRKIAEQAYMSLGRDAWQARMDALLVKLTQSYAALLPAAPGVVRQALCRKMCADPAIQELLQMNWHEGVLWFNKEALERFVLWLLLTAVFEQRLESETDAEALKTRLKNAQSLIKAAEAAGYRVEELLNRV